MASENSVISDYIDRLRALFRHVPGVEDEDLRAWVTEALYARGYSPDTVDDVENGESGLIVLLAQIQGARAISLATAHYFRYKDAEEEVDKSKVAEQYRKLASDLAREYETEEQRWESKRERNNAFKVMRRLDRDYIPEQVAAFPWLRRGDGR